MTAAAMVFMAWSWSLVLGLTAWAFAKVLRSGRRPDPDGPAAPRPGLRGGR